jgi:hypothetical protein
MHDHVYYRYHTYNTEPVTEQVLVRVRASVLVHFVTSRGFDIVLGAYWLCVSRLGFPRLFAPPPLKESIRKMEEINSH